MSDVRRDEATFTARLKERDKRIMLLEARLRVLRDCARLKCHLCISCLNAAFDED